MAIVVAALLGSYINAADIIGQMKYHVIQWLPIICPTAMAVTSQIALNTSDKSQYYFLIGLQGLFFIVWCFRLTVLKENYSYTSVSLSISIGLIRPLSHLLQNILTMTNVRLEVYLSMMIAITLIDIGLSLTTFRNLSEEIEYMTLITRVFYLFILFGRVIGLVIIVPSHMRLV
jgi:hypothetical protein